MRGYIFRCNDKTKDEVFSRKLLGEELSYLPDVKEIREEDLLFLYNTSTFEFSGPFKPIGNGQEKIVPEAWGGKFPSQIRFEELDTTKTIPFNKIERIIKRFKNDIYPWMELNEEQTKQILNIILLSS